MKFHKIQNVQIALEFLTKKGVSITFSIEIRVMLTFLC